MASKPHEKTMGSYVLFAWRDAMSIAALLDSEFELAEARRIYEATPIETIIDFERRNVKLIGDFLEKTEGQRPPFLKKTTKDVSSTSKLLFLVLAIIGAQRAMRVLEARDKFRLALAPGLGNRVTAAALYDFSNEVYSAFSYLWPSEVFSAMGLYDGACDDDDG